MIRIDAAWLATTLASAVSVPARMSSAVVACEAASIQIIAGARAALARIGPSPPAASARSPCHQHA